MTIKNEAQCFPRAEANRISALLSQALGPERFPVDVEAVAKELSRHQADPISRIVTLDLQGFDGMLRRSPKSEKWQIIYRPQPLSPGRERFTLAHEYGHYVLHRTHQSEFACNPLNRDLWKSQERAREKEADEFASYLLMPIDDFRTQMSGAPFSIDTFQFITSRYGVSVTAAALKYAEFASDRVAVVVSRDGFILWGWSSQPAFKSGVYFKSGWALPNASIARANTDTYEVEAQEAAHERGVWHGEYSCKELSFFSSRHDITVSSLKFL